MMNDELEKYGLLKIRTEMNYLEDIYKEFSEQISKSISYINVVLNELSKENNDEIK